MTSQQPQSPKEQPKKGDQKGDDNKKQGGKDLNQPIVHQHRKPVKWKRYGIILVFLGQKQNSQAKKRQSLINYTVYD